MGARQELGRVGQVGHPFIMTDLPGVASAGREGEVLVFDAESGRLLAQNPMASEEKDIRSAIAIAGGSLFDRFGGAAASPDRARAPLSAAFRAATCSARCWRANLRATSMC